MWPGLSLNIVRVIESSKLMWAEQVVKMKDNRSAIKMLEGTFKYHVSCPDGKISVRINLLFYLFFHRRPIL